MTGAPSVVALRGVGKTFAQRRHGARAASISISATANSSRCSARPAAASRRRLRIIAGLTEPTSGLVIWRDRDVSGHNPAGEIGFVFQEPTLMPWASVAGNVYLPLKLQGLGVSDAAARYRRGADACRACRISRMPIRANCPAA